MLLGQRLREDEVRDGAVAQDLPQQATGSPLLVERDLQFRRGHKAVVDQKQTERAPGKVSLIHRFPIGMGKPWNERVRSRQVSSALPSPHVLVR